MREGALRLEHRPQHVTPPAFDFEQAKLLHQLIVGYRASQAISAVARFGIADRLAAGPLTLDDLAVRLDIAHDYLCRLLRAAASIGLIAEIAPRTFALAPLGEPLRSDVPGSLRNYAMTLTAPGNWLPWARLPHAVVSRQPQAPPALGVDIVEYYRQHPDEARLALDATWEFGELLSADILRLYDFSAFSRIIDLGAWQGALLAAILGANETAHGLVLVSQECVEGLQRRLQDRGVSGRSDVIETDGLESPAPRGDVYLLEQLIDDQLDDEASVVLRRCREGLAAGGRVVVIETLPLTAREAGASQFSDLNALVLRGGRSRSAEEYRALFASAGLELESVVRLEVQPDVAILVGAPVEATSHL